MHLALLHGISAPPGRNQAAFSVRYRLCTNKMVRW
jgi:hypothetical protein